MKNQNLKWNTWLESRIKEVKKEQPPKALPEEKQKIFQALCRAQPY